VCVHALSSKHGHWFPSSLLHSLGHEHHPFNQNPMLSELLDTYAASLHSSARWLAPQCPSISSVASPLLVPLSAPSVALSALTCHARMPTPNHMPSAGFIAASLRPHATMPISTTGMTWRPEPSYKRHRTPKTSNPKPLPRNHSILRCHLNFYFCFQATPI